MTQQTQDWWRRGVLYQVYPRSYSDADGDGNGDLAGLRARLDHLEWLGIDGIWLSPTMPSPNDDWGYDVADYRGVHPDFGTLGAGHMTPAATYQASPALTSHSSQAMIDAPRPIPAPTARSG